MPKTYTIILKEKREVAQNTLCFSFEKPADFEFVPGQFCTLIYDNPPFTDKRGNRRPMSLASSPTEPIVSFAMRAGESAFKKSMWQAEIGTEMSIIGPAGNLVIPEKTDQHIVMIAGGIGVVPFRSMVQYATDGKLPYTMTLLYFNHQQATTAFVGELTKLDNDNKFFSFIPVLTGAYGDDPKWTGKRGYFSEELLKETVNDFGQARFMVVGTPEMVEKIMGVLKTVAIPEEQISIEKFTGFGVPT